MTKDNSNDTSGNSFVLWIAGTAVLAVSGAFMYFAAVALNDNQQVGNYDFAYNFVPFLVTVVAILAAFGANELYKMKPIGWTALTGIAFLGYGGYMCVFGFRTMWSLWAQGHLGWGYFVTPILMTLLGLVTLAMMSQAFKSQPEPKSF